MLGKYVVSVSVFVDLISVRDIYGSRMSEKFARLKQVYEHADQLL